MQSLPTIALLSVNSDPAAETESQNVYVRQVGETLSRLGWQVDVFTRKTDSTQSDIMQHNLNCRTIRLTARAEQFVPRQRLIGFLPEFLKQLRQFQQANNIQYRLIHTNYWLSAWTDMELKKIHPLKQVNTYHSLGAVQYANINHLSHLLKYVVNHKKNCLLCTYKNTVVLSQAIHRMIAEPLWRCQLGISVRERVVDLFTWDDIANQLSKLNLNYNM